MSEKVNRFGLRRNIRADVKREARRQCGFGCVICGTAIVEYEHFDPPFEDATEHRVEGIALLCGSCHSFKTRGIWSVEKVAKARRSPKSFKQGASKQLLELDGPLTLRVGTSSVESFSTIVRTKEGDHWFVVEEPEEDGGPILVSVVFFDDANEVSLEIQRNELICKSDLWDFDVEGSTFMVRNGPRNIVLELHTIPPNVVMINRLKMRKGDVSIIVERDGRWTVRRGEEVYSLKGCLLDVRDAVFLI